MRQCHHEVFLQVKIRGKTNRAQARMRWKLTLEILMSNADQELFETTHSLRSRIYSHKKASDFGFTNMSRSHGTLFTCYPRIGMSHWSLFNASINAILLLIHLVMSFYVHRQVEQMSYHIPSPTTELAMQQSWPRMTIISLTRQRSPRTTKCNTKCRFFWNHQNQKCNHEGSKRLSLSGRWKNWLWYSYRIRWFSAI